jgi:hypothetical protein
VRIAIALLLACLAGASLAAAGGHASKPKDDAPREKGSGFAGPRIPTISMPVLVTPVIVNGELHHYVFLSVTLELTSDEHKPLMLEKIPYLQDAYLREVHGATVARDNDPALIDEAGVKDRLMKVSATVVGPSVVKTITLRNVVQGVH